MTLEYVTYALTQSDADRLGEKMLKDGYKRYRVLKEDGKFNIYGDTEGV